MAKSLKLTLGMDVADKQGVLAGLDKELPLVVVDPNAQSPVKAMYGTDPSQCTIDITRYPLNTICCNKFAELGEWLRKR